MSIDLGSLFLGMCFGFFISGLFRLYEEIAYKPEKVKQ